MDYFRSYWSHLDYILHGIYHTEVYVYVAGSISHVYACSLWISFNFGHTFTKRTAGNDVQSSAGRSIMWYIRVLLTADIHPSHSSLLPAWTLQHSDHTHFWLEFWYIFSKLCHPCVMARDIQGHIYKTHTILHIPYSLYEVTYTWYMQYHISL